MSQNITQKLSAGVARVLLCLLVSEAAPLSANQDTPGAQAAEAVVGGLNLVIVEGDGAVVTFPASGAGPTGVFGNGSRVLTLLTNSKGQAVMQGLKTNHVAGALKINVTASFHGQTATAAITQTNAAAAAGTSAAAGGLLSVKAIAIIAGIGAAAIGGIVAGLAQGGSSSAKTNQGTTISPGAVTIGTPH
jgi:hypothetical protein